MSLTYLVTGGAGFIGSHLSDALLAEGHNVLALDDLSTGNLKNIEHLRAHPRFELVVGSVMDRPLTSKLVSRADGIFHLAAVVGVARVMESIVRTIQANIGATDALLRLADEKKTPVLLTSSSEVYGKSERLPFLEDADLIFGASHKGRWSYACGKAMDEYLALAYYRERQLPTVIARLFNTVGPRQSANYGMVMPRFVERALAGRPIPVYGDGCHRRCFGYVGDVVWALTRLMAAEEFYGQIFNIGSEEEISILELAHFIKDRLGSASDIVFIPFEEVFGELFEESVNRLPDLTRIRTAIGYEPRTTLAQIVDHVADEYRNSR
jgi:UDP-glucose 4-epimerase